MDFSALIGRTLFGRTYLDNNHVEGKCVGWSADKAGMPLFWIETGAGNIVPLTSSGIQSSPSQEKE